MVLEGVSKVFSDGTRAVSDVDLEIGDGEFVVLVGPSGCGKTTLLRMVAGLEDISDGTIRIGDRVVNHAASKDRDVAMVFQSYALYPHLNVADNIGFGLKLRKAPRAEIKQRVEQAAAMLGLSELLDRKPRNLSGGQRQRVAMGRAIVRDPQAFLMDEPLSNLDAKLRVQMRGEISRLQRALGTTTIYVTHDQVEAMTMGDRVAVMKKGVLQQVDNPSGLYDRPHNLFVAGFIGSPAMNLVEGTVEINARPAVSLGEATLGLPDSLLDERPTLRSYAGRKVVVGIRPEDLEDAALVADTPADRRLRATVDLVEALGAELNVHFDIDAPPVLTDDTRELAADVGEVAVEELEADATRARVVARFGARSAAREGEAVDVVVDTERLHFFDPDSGRSIRDGAAA